MIALAQWSLVGGAALLAGVRTEHRDTGAGAPVDSGQFAIYKLQQHVGAESYSRRAGQSADTLTTAWNFHYLGSDVVLHATLVTDHALTPQHFEIRGQTSTSTDVETTIDIDGHDARVTDRGQTTTTRRRAVFFTATAYPPVAIEEAMFRHWRTHGRPASLALLPRGRASFVPRGRDTLHLESGTEVVDRFAVTGLTWGQQSMWATAGGRIVAVVNGDAELDRFEAVRAGYESQLGQFVKGSVADGLAELASVARHVRPVHAGRYALVGAQLIDGTGAPPVQDAVVVIRDGRIEAAGPRGTVSIPPDAPSVNVGGQTIIPGLWDMHVHFEQVEWPAAQLAAGVTTARDVGNEFELEMALRDAIASGQALGPRLLLAGLIDGGPSPLGVHIAATPEEAQHIVQFFHDAGFRQMKIYQTLPPPLVSVVAAEAHRLGMTVTGHVPTGMTAIEFVEAGADQINHAGFVLAVMQPPPPQGQPRPPIDLDSPQAQQALAFFVAHRTVFDPTLARSEQYSYPKDSSFARYEPGVSKAPTVLADVLNAGGATPEALTRRRAALHNDLVVINALHKAGLPVVAGTDLVVPGHSIARELELEVQAGFTPMEALQAATVVPARVMGLEDSSGSIGLGKRADLVLLAGDPLKDISAVRHVRAVITAGRMYLPAPLWRAAGFTP